MRRRILKSLAFGVILSQGGFAMAQSSIDALEQELNEAKQQHQDATSQAVTNFFSQVDTGMNSADAAVALYQQAGGSMPALTPVVTQNVLENVTEKEARLAKDQANITRLGLILQLHCGLLHYGGLFVVNPDQKGLQDQFIEWLKTAAQLYVQLEPQPTTDDSTQQTTTTTHHHHHDDSGGGGNGGGGGGASSATPFDFSDMKHKSLHDSIITKYLSFKSWGDKEQGGWSVREIPDLYKKFILDPLRTKPTAETLAAWDVYIAMLNSDETDNDRWNQVIYPPLQFDKGTDDYLISQDTSKLEVLIGIIKANPTSSHVDDWVDRVHKLMDDYRSQHGGPSTIAQAPTPTPAANSNTTVTSVQDGDMTVITTKKNNPPAPGAPSPAPQSPPASPTPTPSGASP